MALNKISDAAFRNFKPSDNVQIISDGGGLIIRVRPKNEGGSVSFMLSYRIEGKQRQITLKAKSLKEARKERDIYKEQVKQGKDPILERKLETERTRQQQLEEQENLAKLNARITVNDLFIRWTEIDLINRKDRQEIIRMFNKDVLPVLGDLFVEDVRKGHITQVTDALLVRGVNRMAKVLLGLMRQMFRFAVDRDIIEFDPTASIRKAKVGGKDVERDRTLNQDEIKQLAQQLPSSGLMQSTECAIWIALSTLCRIGELSKAKHSDIDIVAKTWKIPETNSKNGKAHVIYLSNFSLAQFNRLKSLSGSETWLFPNRDNSDHVCDKSITKQIDGRQTKIIYSHRSKHSQALVLPNGKWTPHDLRRSGATLMGKLGIQGDVIEKCLNHTEENKVKRIYQRQGLEEEQAAAWQTLGERLNLLLGCLCLPNDSLPYTFS
ncbi:tyrosine-type recombinase/integrase [Methylovulum psychrotolerans]|uniref:Integrase n=1 Tax=Methylovulum psychrotolerans TaxID=1704499 RepID=A0A1Z4BW47_9GAMM|nr:site-specific integrase [Methylovulum psychrotolerans]ASF45473.1 integrase [Methylovulum psychrotolerans]